MMQLWLDVDGGGGVAGMAVMAEEIQNGNLLCSADYYYYYYCGCRLL